VRHLPQSENLGCGGGLRQAEEYALATFASQYTHVWILDDDTVVAPDSLAALLAALEKSGAEAAAPMILNETGRIGWFSGLTDPEKFRVICRAQTPAEYLAASGPDPVPFSWSTGICLLLSRRALETVGLHRTDFWIRGEDLEFSLRITGKFPGVFVPTVSVQHLPPPAQESPASQRSEYLKSCAHLQNVGYIGLHLPHGRRIAGKIPGNLYRFLKDARCAPRAFLDATRALWHGAVLRQPAGTIDRLRSSKH
jgi:GT2 family glycosyltransferase